MYSLAIKFIGHRNIASMLYKTTSLDQMKVANEFDTLNICLHLILVIISPLPLRVCPQDKTVCQ